jgi:anti-sigma factor RsiW
MCEFSGKLVAWIDGELPEDEMAAVGAHVPWCNDCRREAEAFRKVSVAFAECARTVAPQRARRIRAGVVAVAGIAAAVLVALLVMPRKSPELQARLVIPGIAATKLAAVLPQATRAVARPVKRIAKRVSKPVPAQAVWMPAEPTVQIVIPADALLPPGALPDGINFVADLQLAANGSPASVALRP